MAESTPSPLRCPFDPAREATLSREAGRMTCERCEAWFPVRNGIPVLLIAEAELPAGCREVSQLPCQRHSRKAR
jgi:uncharacterized protein YbaR (Trm112 family)